MVEETVERIKKIAQAFNKLLKPVEIIQEEAPRQEHVISDDLGVRKWMVPLRHTELETEMTTGSGQSVIGSEYFDGGSHIDFNRKNFRWGNISTFESVPRPHIRQIEVNYCDDEEPIPLTMCFGIPPTVNIIAGSGLDCVILSIDTSSQE